MKCPKCGETCSDVTACGDEKKIYVCACGWTNQ